MTEGTSRHGRCGTTSHDGWYTPCGRLDCSVCHPRARLAQVTNQQVKTPPALTDPPVWAPHRRSGYTVEDLLADDNAPRQTELLDGVPSVPPSPTMDHQDIGALLWWWLRRHAPAGLRPALAVGVMLDAGTTLEPDVLLLREPVQNHHYFTPDRVVLAVEVVSPSTERRDRTTKPPLYAEAGVKHLWRIEQHPLRLFAYHLAGGAYRLVASSADLLVLDDPFPLCLNLADITP